jgi:hypothetical protein
MTDLKAGKAIRTRGTPWARRLGIFLAPQMFLPVLEPNKGMRMNDKRWMLWAPWLLLAALAGFGFVIKSRLEDWAARMVCPFLWATFALLGAAVWRSRKAEGESVVGKGEEGRGKGEARSGRGEGEKGLWQIVRSWLWPVGVGFGLTAICFLSVEPAFRVLSDETNLVSTSLLMYREQKLQAVLEMLRYYDTFHVTVVGPAHRPAMFPFCMSVLHSLFGYNPYHGFVVNFLASALILTAVIRFGRRVLDQTYGLIAAVLLAAFPLYALTATSSGFDTLNLLFVMLVLFQMHRFLEQPDGTQLEILLLLTVLAAQCRYESILLFVPVGAACLWKWRAMQGVRFSWQCAVAPVLLLPVFWQRISVGTSRLQKLPQDTELFSLGSLWRNLSHAADFFFNPSRQNYPTSTLICLLALGGAAWLLWRWYSTERELRSPLAQGCVLAGVGVALIGLSHLLYSMGDYRASYQMRIAVVYLAVLSLCAAYPVYRLWQRSGMDGLLTVALAGFLCYGLSQAARNERGRGLTAYREYKRNIEFLKGYPKESTLVISDSASKYAVQGYGSVGPNYANKRAEALLKDLQRHLFTDILVIQRVAFASQQATPKLDPRFVLVPLFGYQNGGDHFIRISKVAPPLMPAPFARPAAPATLQLPPSAVGRSNVSSPPSGNFLKQK